MTICTTFSAVFATPLLTQYLAGAYVPVDAAGLALSTLQVSNNACGKAIIVFEKNFDVFPQSFFLFT